jgi:hypothetical protein
MCLVYSGQVLMALHPVVHRVCNEQPQCLVLLDSHIGVDLLVVLADTKDGPRGRDQQSGFP